MLNWRDFYFLNVLQGFYNNTGWDCVVTRDAEFERCLLLQHVYNIFKTYLQYNWVGSSCNQWCWIWGTLISWIQYFYNNIRCYCIVKTMLNFKHLDFFNTYAVVLQHYQRHNRPMNRHWLYNLNDFSDKNQFPVGVTFIGSKSDQILPVGGA